MGRRKASARREPVFDVTPTAPELRVQPEDRPVPTAREERKAANDRGSRATRKPRGRADAASSKAKRSKGGKGGGNGGFFRRLLYWALVAGIWMTIVLAAVVGWFAAHLPPIQSLEIPKRPPSVQILGLNGQLMAMRGEMAGTAVPLRELPSYLGNAFIAIEDRRFHAHFGIDPIGVGRALAANVLHRGVAQGGSTLTQQLAKNLFLTQERTISRKIQEVLLALWLEHKYSKAQILELYLNRVYFGAGAYGVEAAAQRYFAKSARQVTLAEAALLAGLVKSPSRLAPTRNFDGAEKRAHLVLAAMADAKLITPQMAKAAVAGPLRLAQLPGGGSANYVADWVMDLLDDLIGHLEQDVVVETTIDPALQSAAEKALVGELVQKGDKFGVAQGALVSMSPDGAVRALVGGRNYTDSPFNRAVAAKRQPGSAFKPFVYLTAIERGLTPDSVRDDRPIVLKGWKPENYGREYFGAVTLTHALANSLNTVAVRLTLEVGPAAVVKTAHRLGIASKLEANPSIALGTSEVSVLELVGAYGRFTSGGVAVTPHVVARVRGPKGKVLYTYQDDNFGRVVDARHVAMMNAMMQETLLTGTARKAELPGWPAAGKTGTSQDFRDAWFVGYTAHLVTGVWLGNDDGTPTKKLTGSGLPVEVWSQFMKVAHQGVPVAGLPGFGGGGGGGSAVAAAVPPGRIAAASAHGGEPRPAPADDRSGLDGWLLDRLFGRR